jgi:hypothetical protein
LVENLFVSNGMSAGNTLAEAQVQCLSEIFERAVKREILEGEICLPDVPPDVLANYPSIMAGIQGLEDQGFPVLVKDASLGGIYPVMCVTLMNPRTGGVFASFSGDSFRETINYLDQPLKETENTQEKARILTVLGYSQAWRGNQQQAIALHQEAVNLAQEVGDQRCEIANLNHLSRISLYQKDFSASESDAQRAVILARQIGDRQGEANGLANLGYSEVMIARQHESITPEELDTPIGHLERGQKLSEKLNDLQNQALCWVGLGTAYIAIQQPSQAQLALEKGLVITQQIGDRDLQALSHSYLGEVFYQLNQFETWQSMPLSQLFCGFSHEPPIFLV